MSYNSQQKLKDNIGAIRIALNWSAEKQLTADQISALKNYAGFGGLKAVLFPNSSKEEWKKLNTETHFADYVKNLSKNQIQKFINLKKYFTD